MSCGFAGVTRPAASKRTCKDATERERERVEEGSGFGEGLTAVRLAISTDKIINFIRIFVCARLATVQLNLLGVIS